MLKFFFLALIGVCAAIALADDSATSDPPFHKELKQAAADYFSWGRVDDEFRWAPELCRMPNPGKAYSSASVDGATHGRKIYSLFAKDRRSYIRMEPGKPAPIGQAIVKQSWVPEEVTGETADAVRKINNVRYSLDGPAKIVVTEHKNKDGAQHWERFDHFFPYVIKGDKVFKAGKQADLFIMLKLDPKTQNTDDGWVYGTVTPDGKTVTSAGKVASCMKCHADAKADRLFGLPGAK
jgi:cytochrome P460